MADNEKIVYKAYKKSNEYSYTLGAFPTMELINKSLPVPLVLHGGTGIPDDKIRMAISKGISKININTELQSVWSKAVRKYLLENEDVYDPRKIISSGEAAMKERISEIVTLFGTKI